MSGQSRLILLAILLVQICALGQCQTVASETFQGPAGNISAVAATDLEKIREDVAAVGKGMAALRNEFSEIKGLLLNLTSAISQISSAASQIARVRNAEVESFARLGFTYSEVTQCSYKAVLQSGHFQSARSACKAMAGSDLASIHSLAEQQFISKLVGARKKRYWIGGTDKAREAYWKWVDETPFNFEYWQAHEPSSSGLYEDCAEMNFARTRPVGGWNDLSCWHRLDGYVCKKCFQ